MAPTRFTSGVTTTTKETTLGQFILPDVTTAHTYFEDFDYYTAANWTVTETQASATQALGNEDGGVLVLTNSASDDDLNALQKVGESFRFAAGKKLWFKARFKVSDATQSDVVIGLQITDTTPLDVTDGVFFLKADGSTTLNLLVEKDGTATTTAVGSLVSDTYATVGFYYDGVASIAVFLNDVQVGLSAVTNLPDDEDLTISFGVQNGEAAAKVMTVDYILAAKER